MYQPNILHIDTIKGDWSDNDNIMLHACFKLLMDCIENENLLKGHVVWDEDEETMRVKKEIETLYEWWKERLTKELDEKFDAIWIKNQYEEDNEMLIRLIKVRQYLWT